jgi:aspartyl-tRNA(Asn)/glutamyl-tRNA(Gln) amidotransferase subunit A
MDGTTLPDEGEQKVSSKVIGVPRAFVKDAQEGMRREFELRLEELAKKGYEIVDIEFPSAPYGLAAYYIVMPAEVSTNLARLDGMRYGLSVEGKNLFEEYAKSRAEGFGPETRRRIILGSYVLFLGAFNCSRIKAMKLM